MSILKNFVREEQGQDLIEYTLLLAFVCLASAAIFIGMGGSLKSVWVVGNADAANAANVAVGGTS